MAETWKQWEGQVIEGKFYLRRYLAGSRQSAVFLAVQGRGQPQEIAIRLVPATSERAEPQLARWRAAVNLVHPNLLRLFQMGRCRLDRTDFLYLVMEFAEEDLSQVLPHRALTEAETREMLRPAVAALAYIHDKGFVHGHMKPANIMGVNDQLKLSSDGLWRIGEPRGWWEQPCAYDPPEAASGIALPAGDVWSLGMTLVESLTQQLPVWESTERGEPALPPNLPAPYSKLAYHCLQRNPQDRWTIAQVAAWLQELRPAAAKVSVARPWYESARWRQVFPKAGIGLALAAAVAVPMILRRRPQIQPPVSVVTDEANVLTGEGQGTSSAERPHRRTKTDRRGRGKVAEPAASMGSQPGADVSASSNARGEVLKKVLPGVTPKARDTIQGTIRVSVRVSVDGSGNVVGATLSSPGPSAYFANQSIQAANRWKFRPPQIGGRPAASQWLLRFEFINTSTHVVPAQASP